MAVRTDGLPWLLAQRNQFAIQDDFLRDVDSADWATVISDLGSAAVGDVVAGILALVPSDASVGDNDETYARTANKLFKFAARKPCYFEARVQFTEASTNAANILVGLSSTVAADTLVDNGGGPPSNYSGAVFFKIDGGTVWQAETSNGTTQTTTELSASNANNIARRNVTAGGSAYQTLRIDYQPYSATNAYVTFSVDGVVVAQHDYIFTSAVEMYVGFGVKNGSANLETLNVDYVACIQER